MAICLERAARARPPEGGCPVPWPRRAASTAMLRVAAGRIPLFTPVKPALVSVALTVGHPTPACAGHPALRCLDFPLRRVGATILLPTATGNYTRLGARARTCAGTRT